MDPAEIKTLIEKGLPDSDVQVFSEDHTHYAAVVVSKSFEGLRRIARHQMIYRSLGKLIGNEIHAMSIRAHTPLEWSEIQTGAAE